MKVLTYRNVLQRITDLADFIDVSANLPRIKRLIYKAAIDSRAAVSMITKTVVPVEIKNGIGELPCDLLRLLRAYGSETDNGKDMYRTGRPMEKNNLRQYGKYDKTNTHIKPSWLREGTIYIDYYAVPTIEVTDENGDKCQEIQIAPSQLDYCAYEVIRILARDELVRGKIHGNVYQLFEEEAAAHYQVAVGDPRQLSIDDMESAAWMMRNGQFFNLR
jgi:hypothetical protein